MEIYIGVLIENSINSYYINEWILMCIDDILFRLNSLSFVAF